MSIFFLHLYLYKRSIDIMDTKWIQPFQIGYEGYNVQIQSLGVVEKYF